MALELEATVGLSCFDCSRKGRKKIVLRGPGIFKLGCALCKSPWIDIRITSTRADIIPTRRNDNMWGMFEDRLLREVD